jgi:hypothetical protein
MAAILRPSHPVPATSPWEIEMTARQTFAVLLARDEIVAPPAARACQDRTFEVPTVLYLATAVPFLAFVGVVSFASRSPEMAVPFGVFAAFILAFFTIPALWTRITPKENASKALGWDEFLDEGEGGDCRRLRTAFPSLERPSLQGLAAVRRVLGDHPRYGSRSRYSRSPSQFWHRPDCTSAGQRGGARQPRPAVLRVHLKKDDGGIEALRTAIPAAARDS